MTASLLRGAASPRVDVHPLAVDTLGWEAAELAAAAGLELEPWQRAGLDTMLGVREDGKWACFEYAEICARQNGKALDVDTPVLTTAGWSTMGALQVDDEVFHPDGHPTRVAGAYDVMHGHDCYRVTTTDGRSAIADGEHLWTVQDKRSRRGWETLTTGQLVERGLMRFDRARPGGGRQREFAYRLPRQHAVVSKPVDLPVDPYLLGAWLGDGNSASAQLSVGDQDLRETTELIEATGARIVSTRRDKSCWLLRFSVDDRRRKVCTFRSALVDLGIWGDKRVPGVYLAAGTEQRLALLQGLLDTDGSIDKVRGQVEFCATNRDLAEGVLFLARSLGWRATIRESAATLHGREVGRRWRVMWTPAQGDPVPFRLRRKVERVQTSNARGGELHAVSIASIEPVESRPVRCIKVDRPDGLFLAGRDLVATHNTALFKARALAGFFLLGEQLIVWSAHEVKTAMRAWRDIRSLLLALGTAVNDNLIDIDGILVKVNASNGSEGFERLDTGQEIRMVARSKGSGRGWSVDFLFFDEAFALESEHQDALMPTLTARPNPQVGYASSPPLSGTTAGPMYALKQRAEAGGDETLGYRDWGLDDVLDDVLALPAVERAAFLDDRDRWAATNPALGLGRVSEESTLRLRRALSDAGYAREILGCWPRQVDLGAGDVVDAQTWADTADTDSRPGTELVLAIGVGANKRSAAIASSGRRADGRLHVKVMDYRPGTGWAVDRIVELRDRLRPKKIMLDPASPAGALIADLANAGVELEYVTGREMAQACGALVNDLVEDRIRHCDQDALNTALTESTAKASGDAWKWAPKDSAGDISPLVAVTAAAHGFRLYGAQEEVVPWAQWV